MHLTLEILIAVAGIATGAWMEHKRCERVTLNTLRKINSNSENALARELFQFHGDDKLNYN
jgi:hypothetical protein